MGGAGQQHTAARVLRGGQTGGLEAAWGHQEASLPDPATEVTQPGGSLVPGPPCHPSRPAPFLGLELRPSGDSTSKMCFSGVCSHKRPPHAAGKPRGAQRKTPAASPPCPAPRRLARPLPCPGHQGPWGSTAHRCPPASTFSLLVPLPVSPGALKGQPPDRHPCSTAPRPRGSPHTLCCPLSLLGWLPPPPARSHSGQGTQVGWPPGVNPGVNPGVWRLRLRPWPAGGFAKQNSTRVSGKRAGCTRLLVLGQQSRA